MQGVSEMQGYLNYFENECNFIADTAYDIKEGNVVLVCSGDEKGKKAVFQKENGKSSLKIEEKVISDLQGIVLEVEDEFLIRKYAEKK